MPRSDSKRVSTRGLSRILNHNSKYKGKEGLKIYYRSYYQGALRKEMFWCLDPNEFYDLVTDKCEYCGKPPELREYKGYEPFYANSIDRLNNDMGYYKFNCQTACSRCNSMKSDRDIVELIIGAYEIWTHFSKDMVPGELDQYYEYLAAKKENGDI